MLDTLVTAVLVLPMVHVFSTQTVAEFYRRGSKANLDKSGSDRNRPKDYRRAVVIDAGPKNTTNEDTLRSERRSALKKTIDAADIVRDVQFGVKT
jgi:hypothetical protein